MSTPASPIATPRDESVHCPHCGKPMVRVFGVLMHTSTGSANCWPGQFSTRWASPPPAPVQ